MATTNTYTVSEICTDALRKIGVVAVDETATAEQIETARKALGRMLKHWQNFGFNLWTVASQTVTLTTAGSYTLDPVRPVQIESVRFNNGTIETPMERITREEYDSIPNKTTTGQPTQWYYDKQREAAKLYIWPVMSSVASETLEITYHREVNDAVLTDPVDVPSEMYDAVVYNLGSMLTDDFAVAAPQVVQRAEMLKQEALAFDREGSVFFAGPYAG